MSLYAICKHFDFSEIPFIKCPKLPFENECFVQNKNIFSTAFLIRQLVTVTGPSGSGKSSFVNYAINDFEPSSHRIIVSGFFNPKNKEFYSTLSSKSGLTKKFYADDAKNSLIEFLENENRQGRFNVIILDDVHTFSMPMLSEVLSFYEESNNFSLVLVGLTDLFNHKLNLSVNIPIKRRISIMISTEALTLRQTKDYIQHHLNAAKNKNQVFDEKCFPLIHSVTNGLPGQINQLCITSIFEAFKNKVTIIDEEIIRTASSKLIGAK